MEMPLGHNWMSTTYKYIFFDIIVYHNSCNSYPKTPALLENGLHSISFTKWEHVQ